MTSKVQNINEYLAEDAVTAAIKAERERILKILDGFFNKEYTYEYALWAIREGNSDV